MLSGVMVLSPYLLPLPILTLVLGGFALRPSRSGPPIGRRPALAGMFLAIFFTGWGYTRAEIREQALAESGQRFAEYWLELTRMGEWEVVLELLNHPEARQHPKMPLKEFYANSESRSQLFKEFKERRIVEELIAAGDQVEWQLVKQPKITQRYGIDHVEMIFEDANSAFSGKLRVEMMREWNRSGTIPGWQVHEFDSY